MKAYVPTWLKQAIRFTARPSGLRISNSAKMPILGTALTTSYSSLAKVEYPSLTDEKTLENSIIGLPKLPPIPDKMLELIDSSNKATVVIIGGRSQLGEELRRRYAASGWNVVCTTRFPTDTKKEERDYHIFGDIDLADKVSSKKKYWEILFGSITTAHGPIHTVINCAAVASDTPKASADDINRRPVKPMLEACIDMKINRYVFMSSKAADIESVRYPGSYASTKYNAEQEILEIANNEHTKITIFRPDMIISANNPGQFGGPQMMSASRIKVTIGTDAKTAGSATIRPVTATDLAHAMINISERDIDTPDIIDASGPEAYTMSKLLDFFKEQQNKKFFLEVQMPVKALYPFAAFLPNGAFEKNHLDLLKHYDSSPVISDNETFTRLVGRPLSTLKEEFESVNRPVYGDPNIAGYATEILKNMPVTVLPSMTAGIIMAAALSRINFNPHRQDRTPDDGVNTGHLFLVAFAVIGVASLLNDKPKETEKDKPNPKDKILSKGPAISKTDSIAASKVISR